MTDKSLWPACLTCRKEKKLVNNFCNLQCLKEFLTNCHFSSIPCQHPIRDRELRIIGWKDDCSCSAIIQRIKFEIFNKKNAKEIVVNKLSNSFRNVKKRSNSKKGSDALFQKRTFEKLNSQYPQFISLTKKFLHYRVFPIGSRRKLDFLTLTSKSYISLENLYSDAQVFIRKLSIVNCFSVIEEIKDKFHIHLLFPSVASYEQYYFAWSNLNSAGFIRSESVKENSADYHNVIKYMMKDLLKTSYFFTRVLFSSDFYSEYKLAISSLLKSINHSFNLKKKTISFKDKKKTYDSLFSVKEKKRIKEEISRRKQRLTKFSTNLTKCLKIKKEIKILNHQLKKCVEKKGNY